MADDGFDFRHAQRREARTFEPPPWEQDQFDALARQRAEQAAAEAHAAEVAAALKLEEAEAAAAVVPEEARAAEPATPMPDAAKATVPADEATVARMLAELAAEEPQAKASYWKANVFVGGALVIFGSVFLIWGMAGLVASKGSGMAGLLGGSVMLLFGAGFVFGGLYVVVKNLRQRGVL